MPVVKENKRKQVPKKCTKEFMKPIFDDIAAGVPIKYATESNMLTQCQFYAFVRQGLLDIRTGNEDSFSAWVVQTLNTLQKANVMKCLADIKDRDRGHKGSEWILERLYWRVFSPNAAVLELSEEIEQLRELGAQNVIKEKELDSGSAAPIEQGEAPQKAKGPGRPKNSGKKAGES